MTSKWIFGILMIVLLAGCQPAVPNVVTFETCTAYGQAHPIPYEGQFENAWGGFNKGWRIWGVRCDGKMAELLGQHAKEFEQEVE